METKWPSNEKLQIKLLVLGDHGSNHCLFGDGIKRVMFIQNLNHYIIALLLIKIISLHAMYLHL